jgi:hypothetical protein
MIAAAKAEETLKLGREAIRGLVALRESGELDQDSISMAAITLANVVTVLDLFLTGGTHMETPVDAAQFFTFLAGSPSARMSLSDGQTFLVLRWPTEEDPRVIYPINLKETRKGLDLRRRWQRIDNADSESVEFPSEVTYGRA